jgi:hypothetical protein
LARSGSSPCAGANGGAPVLVLALLQNLLHAFNHLLDVGEADPAWLGPATLISLVLLSGLAALMLNETGKRAR